MMERCVPVNTLNFGEPTAWILAQVENSPVQIRQSTIMVGKIS